MARGIHHASGCFHRRLLIEVDRQYGGTGGYIAFGLERRTAAPGRVGMTALKRIEQAETLSRNGDRRAAAIAAEVLETMDPTEAGVRARAHRLLALDAWSIGDLDKARRHFGNVANLLETGNAPGTEQAASLGDLALANYALGDFAAALEMRRRALALALQQDEVSPALLRQLRRRLAQSLQQAGEMEEAACCYLAARPDPDDGPEDHIGWLNAMALFNEQRGRILEAADWYAELAAFLSGAEDADGAIAALGNAALFALEVGRPGLAAEQLRAMRRRLRTDRKLASRVAQYDVRMLLLQERGRHLAAADMAARAERLMREHAPDDPSLASRVAFMAGNLRQAGQTKAALDLMERHAPNRTTARSGDTHLLVELAAARRQAGRAAAARQALTLALAAELGAAGGDGKFHVLAGLAELAADADRPRAAALLGKIALAHLRQSALALAGGELSGWLRSRMTLYEQVLTQLTEAGRLPEAQLLQLRQWREPGWALGLRGDAFGDSGTVPFRPGEDRLRHMLARIETNAASRAAADRIQTLHETAQWLDTVWEEDFDGVPTVPALLPGRPDGWPLITYLPKNGGFVGILEQGGDRSTFEIGLPAHTIAQAVRELRNALDERRSDWRQASETLHHALIAPIETSLAAAPRIDFALPGVMSFIPVAMLGSNGRFLVETADIAVRTSRPAGRPSDLAATFRKAAAFATSGSENQPLTGAPAEAIDFAGRGKGDLFLDDAFTAERLRTVLARGVEILHLAGHFRYEPARPYRSALILGDGSELTLAALAGPAYDFSRLKLLVLAACETAVSDSLDMGIEGLAGLAQAKGAQTVLATLWRVEDTSAARLMGLFYDHLYADEEHDPVAALGRAQRAMLREAADGGAPRRGLGSRAGQRWHPADWSGFAAFVAD